MQLHIIIYMITIDEANHFLRVHTTLYIKYTVSSLIPHIHVGKIYILHFYKEGKESGHSMRIRWPAF